MTERIESNDAVQSFYGRWASIYDAVATYTPGISRIRRDAVDALHLEPGDTVLDLGCGTGANLPYLRDAVGADGTVIGIDITEGMLEKAQQRVDRHGWENVELYQQDAADPEVSADVDAILNAFLIGMFPDQRTVIDRWCDELDGGRMSTVYFDKSDRRYGYVVNKGLNALIAVSTPPTRRLRYPDEIYEQFYDGNEAARNAFESRATDIQHDDYFFGTIKIMSGTVSE